MTWPATTATTGQGWRRRSPGRSAGIAFPSSTPSHHRNLRILRAALVYVNTLMLQDLLAEPAWDEIMTPEDQRGLTPLFWSHVLPYGEVKLNMTSRLLLGTT